MQIQGGHVPPRSSKVGPVTPQTLCSIGRYLVGMGILWLSLKGSRGVDGHRPPPIESVVDLHTEPSRMLSDQDVRKLQTKC